MRTYSEVGIIGSGPGGLQAALYTTRRNIETIIFGAIDSSAIYNAKLENLCCVDFATGDELLENTKSKVDKIGAKFTDTEVLSVNKSDEGFVIIDSNRDEFIFKTILFATGISHKKLGVPGEKEYLGRGVSNCVECDANFFRGKDVSVVGSKSAAIDGVEVLANLAKKVTLITQKEEIAKDKLERLSNYDNVEIIEDSVSEIVGDSMKVTSVKLNSGDEIDLNGVFVELGAKGVIELTQNLGLTLDDTFKHIKVDENGATNIENVFAAGDITGAPYQVSTAVGQGAAAGMAMGKTIQKLNRK